MFKYLIVTVRSSIDSGMQSRKVVIIFSYKLAGKLQRCYFSRTQLVPGLKDQYTISKLPCASVTKQALVQNVSYRDKYDLRDNKHVGRTFSRGFKQRLLLTPRQKGTQKRPINW